MGVYLNPKNESKEMWLWINGYKTDFKNQKFDDFISKGNLPVVLVDNGAFTAAGIAYDEREFKNFLDEDNPRPKTYWVVEIRRLLEEVPELENYLDKEIVKKYKQSFIQKLLNKLRR